VASQLIEEITAHVERDSLEDARELCADGTYFPNNLRMLSIPVLATLKRLCRKLHLEFTWQWCAQRPRCWF